MPTCSAVGCSYKHVNKNSGKSIHKFPFSRPEILNEWIYNVGRKYWTPSKSSVLCSDHFTKSCFLFDNKRMNLKKNAVPTIFGQSLLERKHSSILTPKAPNKISRKKIPIERLTNTSESRIETLANTPKPSSKDALLVTSTNSTLLTEGLISVNKAQSEPITTSPFIIKCNIKVEKDIPSDIAVDESAIKCDQTSTNELSGELLKIQNIRSINDQITLQSMDINSNNNLLTVKTEVNELENSPSTYCLRSNGPIANCEEILDDMYMLPNSNATSLSNKIFVAREKFKSISKLKLKYKKELKIKQQKIRRLNKTVNKMQKRIEELELKNSLSTLLHEHFSGFHFDFILKMLTAKKSTRQKFAESIRKFAFVLYAFSPRAYKFMQSQFKKALPHHLQVREWHQIERDRALSEKNKRSLQGTDELQSKDIGSIIKRVLRSEENDGNNENTDKIQSKDGGKSTESFQATDNYVVNNTEGECVIVEYIVENYSELHPQNNISYNSNEIQSAVHYIISEDQTFHSETNGS